MDEFAAMRISSSGMAAQRLRMRLIAENLANQHTTGPDGPYRRKEAVFQSVPLEVFAGELDSALGDILSPGEISVLQAVAVREIAEDSAEAILRYDPSHPYADSEGYVAYPNISIIREMTDLMEASRSYEANLAVMKTTSDMINRAIDLLQ